MSVYHIIIIRTNDLLHCSSHQNHHASSLEQTSCFLWRLSNTKVIHLFFFFLSLALSLSLSRPPPPPLSFGVPSNKLHRNDQRSAPLHSTPSNNKRSFPLAVIPSPLPALEKSGEKTRVATTGKRRRETSNTLSALILNPDGCQ